MAVEGLGRYRRLGATLDDAVGEAFDKAAKLLGLPWPGGPALEQLAQAGRSRPATRCRARCSGRAGCDFTFSGLKTAVAQAVGKHPGGRRLPDQDRPPTSPPASRRAVAAVLADRAAAMR